jgi:hypothetical protein
MNNNAHRRCLYLNFLDAQGASIAVQVARGVDVDAIEIEGVSARDGGAGLDAVQAVALRVCDLDASGQVQAQHQQQLISGVRYRELVQHGGDDSHRGLRPFIHDVLSGVDAHIAAKAGFGCKGNGDRLIPQPESVHRVFTDLMSTMHDAWGHIHECGSKPVRRQWIELIRAYGEHAETPLTPSKAGNAKLSAALRDGSKYVLSHSFLSQTLRTKYERVLERHSGKLSENIQHQIAVTEADFLIDHPTGNSRSVVGLRSPLAFEDAQGQALRSPVELGVHLVPGIRFYEQGFEPVRDSLGLDGYWYPIRRARGPSEVSLTEEVTWEEVKPEPQALQELRAASEDFISAIASQKRQFASYQHADQAAICELFEAIESGGLRPQHLDSLDHVLKRFSEFEPPGKMKSVPAQRMLSAITQNLDEHVRFAQSFIPQPGADEQTLSPQEVAAWRESEISDSGIKALAECGGMSVIRWRSDFRLKLQGVLGRGFDYRIIAVRNALRDQDWVGQPYKKLSKTVGGVEYTLDTRMKLARGGQAITLLDFGVRNTLTGTTHYLSDGMDRNASALAQAINALVQPPVLSMESSMVNESPPDVAEDGRLSVDDPKTLEAFEAESGPSPA